MSAIAPSAAPRRTAPNTVALGLSRVRYEVRSYFRQGDTVFFTFLFPLLMLTIFSVAFSKTTFGQNADGTGGVSSATFYLPAMLSAGILLSGLQNMSIDIATEKSDGTLKRLGGSPLPVLSYFIGKIGQVFLTGLLQALVLILVAHFVFQVTLPTDPARWVTFTWVFVLGVTTCAILGIALSGLPRSGKSATSVIIPITLVLQFISGVYLSFTGLPVWLQNIAAIFPLKWLAQAMRSVFLPESFQSIEQNGSWDLGGVLVVMLLWLVIGLVAARFAFRWIRKNA